MSEMHKIQLGQIKLDVGGEHYTTSLTTLTSAPNSMLAAMFSGKIANQHDFNIVRTARYSKK